MMGLFHKDLKEEIINVEGMMCQHCVARVEDKMKKMKVKAEVSLENKIVKVGYDENKLSIDEIKKAINELGFECK